MDQMIKTIKVRDLPEEEYILPGTRACAGCGMALVFRFALKALGPDTIITIPASCLTVLTGMQGFMSTKIPILHTTFETTAAAASGIIASLRNQKLDEKITAVAFAGDGGTADIGIQGLSGAAERGENIIYACYDNEAYMNTGVQRSSATPYGAYTTTTPIFGKRQEKKNVPAIMAAHGIPYVATACASYPQDLFMKFQKAKGIKGTKYIHILAPCPPGWSFNTKDSIQIGRMAVKTGFWPLYEITNGKFELSSPSKSLVDPDKRKPIEEYLTAQGRFRTLSEEDFIHYHNYINELWESISKKV
ncbi:MAG TPA: 3-methyl-2-oxobutanoate dehydrogenase subunit beta [Candidatus Lokiarchaeia archaeon]|nr:3-methyl-2-oxobutanoate dehydrogenase subunit beta [Candidatus Lokiarchaeia archaeon]